METTTNNRLSPLNHLQNLRDCVVRCYDYSGLYPLTEQQTKEYYNDLFNEFSTFRKEELHGYYERLNINNGEDNFIVPRSALGALRSLQEHITDDYYRPRLARIIGADQLECVDDYCTDFIEFLDREIESLHKHIDSDPTDGDKYALQFLNRYDADKWVSKFIDRPNISIRTRVRRLKLAIAVPGIDEQKRVRLNEVLVQVNEEIEQIKREQAIELAKIELREMLTQLGVGESIITDFLDKYPSMTNAQFGRWCMSNIKNAGNYLKEFWNICMKIAHSDKSGNPTRGWTYRRIAELV